ncbi:class I SAM-dependent methyltransferase [Lederbergia graminis]
MGNFPSCYLCNSESHKIRHNRVRDSLEIKVLECNQCGLVFLSSFDHINEQFYEQSGMLNGNVDLQVYRNNSYQDDLRRANYLQEKITNKSLLDFGCGAGGLLNLLKDKCSKVAGIELDKTLNLIINKEGINCYTQLDEIKDKFDYITLFHVLEHLPDPLAILEKMKSYLNPNGKILIEIPSSDDALLTLYNSETFADFTYWSCHLFLYNTKTLTDLFGKCGYKINYIKQVQRYPLSNHLYWLSKGKPGGHKEWNFINSSLIESEYESKLAAIGKCDTLLAEISL